MIKKELRVKLIKSKIGKLIDSLDFIEENLPASVEDFLNSRVIRNAVYKEVEFAIETILDIFAIINSDLRFGVPEEDEAIINNFEKEKVFSERIISVVKDMKKFRNILVHKYGEINDEQAFENIREGLKDFESIVNEIEEFLKKRRKDDGQKRF